MKTPNPKPQAEEREIVAIQNFVRPLIARREQEIRELKMASLLGREGKFTMNSTVELVARLFSRREQEVRESCAKKISKMKLPIPNPYGKWVRVDRVNMILDQAIEAVKGEK